MALVPFAPEQELYYKPLKSYGDFGKRQHATDADRAEDSCVPGHRLLRISSNENRDFMLMELLTPRLNLLSNHLWLVAKQDSTHISSLTEQVVRGREIILTEDPELHLVWYHDRVFIKPLPKYLLSYQFWHHAFFSKFSPFLDKDERQQVAQAAKGLLRSYAYLIRHKSDFAIAMDPKHRLLPKSIKYSDFESFASACRQSTSDDDVSPRYHFGELRLSRLNFWATVFLRQSTFRKIHHQYSDRLARFYGPLLFLFAVVSVVLNAMQLGLTAQQFLDQKAFTATFSRASQVFAVWTLTLVALTIVLLALAIVIPLLRELVYAVSDLFRKKISRRQKDSSDEPHTG